MIERLSNTGNEIKSEARIKPNAPVNKKMSYK